MGDVLLQTGQRDTGDPEDWVPVYQGGRVWVIPEDHQSILVLSEDDEEKKDVLSRLGLPLF